MSNDSIIKHVYAEHDRSGVSAEDTWEAVLANLGEQTIHDMRNGSDSSWNNDASFEGDSRLMNLGIVYVITFGLIWVISNYLINSELFIIIACGLISIFITLLFMNLTGKNERNYINAVNKLRSAHAAYTNRGGFKDSLGRSLESKKNGS